MVREGLAPRLTTHSRVSIIHSLWKNLGKQEQPPVRREGGPHPLVPPYPAAVRVCVWARRYPPETPASRIPVEVPQLPPKRWMARHLRLVWSERIHREAFEKGALPSWRPYQADQWWLADDAVVASDRGGTRSNFDVYTFGRQVATRHSLLEAKAFLEDVYGPLTWSQVRLPKVEVPHPLGRTEEFTDPTTIYTATLPAFGPTAKSHLRMKGTPGGCRT